jgi:hypothetical protein
MDEGTGVDWDRLLRNEMEWAIQQKRIVTTDDGFKMRVKIVGPSAQIAHMPVTWANEDEKRRAMLAVSHTAKLTLSQAVIITTDARFVNVPGFCKRFGIAESTATNFEAFELERRRIMKGFDFYMGNLPADCYDDNLLVMVKGPRIARMMSTKYAIVEGVAVFEQVEDKGEKITIEMIPEWWS